MGNSLAVRFVETRSCRRPLSTCALNGLNLTCGVVFHTCFFLAVWWRLKSDNYMGPGSAYCVSPKLVISFGHHIREGHTRRGPTRDVSIT